MVTGLEIVEIRPYVERDAAATLAAFLAAVTGTASADYSAEQIAAWSAPHERDLEEWNRVRMNLETIVAVVDEDVVGFSDVSATGYIDKCEHHCSSSLRATRLPRHGGTAPNHPGPALDELSDGTSSALPLRKMMRRGTSCSTRWSP